MLRCTPCAARACALLLLAVLPGLATSASAAPLLSEVFYDAVGSDNGESFVEIYGMPGTDLAGLTVEGINGSGGSVTVSVPLSGLIPADGIFVLADDQGDGTTLVPDADLLANFDFQNGPDSVVLRDELGVLDAVGYGVFDAGEVFAGEGAPAPDVPAGSSLARFLADVDSDDNATDFLELAAPTPGSAPLSVPEPSSAALLATALATLLARRR
ncbi:MAG: PEP-CTERM sorting domain-containing protein [Myxococcota bacterium]|nr:PEP-CTERM sorting domain-containing protein [Myxococcota bacterium]